MNHIYEYAHVWQLVYMAKYKKKWKKDKQLAKSNIILDFERKTHMSLTYYIYICIHNSVELSFNDKNPNKLHGINPTTMMEKYFFFVKQKTLMTFYDIDSIQKLWAAMCAHQRTRYSTAWKMKPHEREAAQFKSIDNSDNEKHNIGSS